MIEIGEPADGGAALPRRRAVGTYDWLVFTSANGVKRIFAEIRLAGRPEPRPA